MNVGEAFLVVAHSSHLHYMNEEGPKACLCLMRASIFKSHSWVASWRQKHHIYAQLTMKSAYHCGFKGFCFAISRPLPISKLQRMFGEESLRSQFSSSCFITIPSEFDKCQTHFGIKDAITFLTKWLCCLPLNLPTWKCI